MLREKKPHDHLWKYATGGQYYCQYCLALAIPLMTPKGLRKVQIIEVSEYMEGDNND